jgi:DDE superfamily endonuclease
MAFLDWATSNQIFVLILPSYSTYRLQSFDVGLFQPLATAYIKQLNKLILKGQGYVSIKKRHFFTLFRQAWADSFTENNIQSAFRKAGIWPIDPEIVIS